MSKQFFAPYTEWEDWRGGMYADAPSIAKFAQMVGRAESLLTHPESLLLFMRKSVELFPTAAKVNLTDTTSNHRPWLGQSACFVAYGCVELATRKAWCLLSAPEQREANAAADLVLAEFMAANFESTPYFPEFDLA